VLSSTPKVGTLIWFNTMNRELKLTIQVRDEDTTEVLKPRWRLVTANMPQRPAESPRDLDYACPEPEIGPTGRVDREDFTIDIPGSRLVRGQCYRLEVAVSSSFKSCERNPELFDITTNEDNEEDIGRATYWIWALAGSTPDSSVFQSLVASCDAYQPPTGTTTSAVEK